MLSFNPIMVMVNNFAASFNCTPMGRASDSMVPPPPLKAIHFSCLGPELLVCCLAHRGSTGVFFSFAPDFQLVIGRPGISIVGQLTKSVSPRF